jgi:hypothetical protein
MGLALGLGLAPVAADDRAPTAEELAAIEAALHAAGYTRWEEIEWDDGGWEVDDARGADGREVDLWLEPDTLAIRAEREDG